MPLSDDILNADPSTSPWADDASPSSEPQWPASGSQEETEASQSFDRPADTPIDESKEYEPQAFKALRPADRNLLKEANDKSWGVHLNAELAGAAFGLVASIVYRRPAVQQLRASFRARMQNIGNVQRPQWYPQMELNTGQFMAGGVIVARLAQERRGWQVGEAVFQKDKEAAASIRRAFGAEDAKATLRAYRLQKQEANLSPKVLARVVYHLRYLSV